MQSRGLRSTEGWQSEVGQVLGTRCGDDEVQQNGPRSPEGSAGLAIVLGHMPRASARRRHDLESER